MFTLEDIKVLHILYLLISLILLLFINKLVGQINRNTEYETDAYFMATKIPLKSVEDDLGRYGEYLIYKCLKPLETDGARFLFNAYIPKGERQTTEIDVMMLHPKGIFIFESKNYGGWIFGSENRQDWYQTLPVGRRRRSHKERFYNPILQNRSHIHCLKELIGDKYPMHSIIVFSERCTLKRVDVNSSDIKVIKRYDTASAVSQICGRIQENVLTAADIGELYDRLYPYTQIDEETKAKHVENIQNMLCDELILEPVGLSSDSAEIDGGRCTITPTLPE